MYSTATIEKQQFTVYYRPGTADELVLNESFDRDIFFSIVPEYRPKATDVIVDVGAHIGCFSLLAATKSPSGAIYSFEPSAETFEILQKNVAVNRLSIINSFQLAMAGSNEPALLYHDLTTGNWGHSIIKAVSAESESVRCITLKAFMESENIQHIDFIKFNCEGAEYAILLNTEVPVLRKIKCMLILYHGYLEDRYTKNQLAGHLGEAGFRIRYRRTNKDDDSGSMIAYRASFFENVTIELRTAPLRISLLGKKINRKLRRVREIIFKNRRQP